MNLLTPHVSRSLMIGQKRLLVLDGSFHDKDIASLHGFLRQLPYRLNDTDSDETAYSQHWKAELPVEMALATPVFRRCIQLTEEWIAASLQLRRVHSNLHLYGDMQFPHVDLGGGATALYYANPDWNEDWLGETVFYDENREPAYAVAPKAGRLVLFHADILHRAGVPSRACYEPRISVAFKFLQS
jgi:Rps23 Pro-64 3,4-dihydroxylase Tpa1-like proline 4-hydroxylase